jgi:NADH-quinone oxidoreductase subunit L
MFFRVSLGKPRSHLAEHAKDPSVWALIPLFILAAGALLLGLIQTPFYKFITPEAFVPSVPIYIEAIPITLLAIGLIVTYVLYGTDRWRHMDFSKNRLYRLAKNKFYLDTLFTNIIAERVITPVSGGIATFENAYNNAVDRTGAGTLSLGSFFRKLQDGVVENYFVVLIIGISIVFIIMLLAGLM